MTHNGKKAKKRPSLVYQIVVILMFFFEPSRDKDKDKKRNRGKPLKDKIYSYGTVKRYITACCTFGHWVHVKHNIHWIDDGQPYAGEYLIDCIRRGMSPYTIATYRSAICKLYQCSTEAILEHIPPCLRADVHRYDAITETILESFYNKHPEIYIVSAGTGMRTHELWLTRVSHYSFKDGRGYVWVKGKGGRVRNLEILPEYLEEIKAIVDRAKEAGRERLFQKIPKGLPIHYMRHKYAESMYVRYARDVATLIHGEQYHCRAEMKGLVLDKVAMLRVSQSLGHNRLGVVTRYLTGLLETT